MLLLMQYTQLMVACLQEGVHSFPPVGSAANAHLLIHEVQALPAAAAAVWAKHGVRT